MKPLPKVMVAPNGARRIKSDHPAIPITREETVACAVACFAAGAGGIHAHIRGADGTHLLDTDQYRDLLGDLRRAVPGMSVQITTEAVGHYPPDVQMDVALSSGAEMVSVSIREIIRAGPEAAAEFYRDCDSKGIAIQHILFDREDCILLKKTLPPPLFAMHRLQLLFVLGRYSAGGASSVAELSPFLEWMTETNLSPDWAVCAFGVAETECLLGAMSNGGKCRVGFENSLYLGDGSVAKDNAEKVVELRARAEALGL